jgi:hypothetical protein
LSYFGALKEQFLFFFGILIAVFLGEGIFPAGKATQHFNILLSPVLNNIYYLQKLKIIVFSDFSTFSVIKTKYKKMNKNH